MSYVAGFWTAVCFWVGVAAADWSTGRQVLLVVALGGVAGLVVGAARAVRREDARLRRDLPGLLR